MLNYSSLHSILSLSTWGPNFNRRWRIERHLKSVVVDDELLTKEGMGDRLTHPELREALWERGMYVFLGALQLRKLILSLSATDDLDKSTLKARIRWWLTMADKSDEGTPVSRRIALVAQSALGQFQVRVVL
jgi:LETM1 and EF-hand domain-containing protein 1